MPKANPDPSRSPFRALRFQSDDGLTLYARDYAGAGASKRSPLVCLHGLTRNSRDFEDFAPRAAELGHRVLVLDMRGRGQSDRDPQAERYHPFVYGADVLTLLKIASVERAGFVGTSMGGFVTMVVAKLAKDRVAGALLNDIGPEISPIGVARIAGYVGKGPPVATWDDARAYAKHINGVAFPRYQDADWDAFARRIFDEGPEGRPVLAYDPAIARAFTTAEGPSAHTEAAWETFVDLVATRPTWLVRGELSDLVDAEIAAKMKARAPSLTIASVPEVGHTPSLVEPVAWDAFLAWSARLDG